MKYEINPLKQIREYLEVVKPLTLLQDYAKIKYDQYKEFKVNYLPKPFRGSYDGPLK